MVKSSCAIRREPDSISFKYFTVGLWMTVEPVLSFRYKPSAVRAKLTLDDLFEVYYG